jgi:hypothetical protein
MEPEQWLDNEDRVEREARLQRLRWLADQMPKVDWMLYGTGPISKYLFDEARYCFAYGQYLASIVLGLAFIELSLGGAFYGVGRNDIRQRLLRQRTDARSLQVGMAFAGRLCSIYYSNSFLGPPVNYRSPKPLKPETPGCPRLLELCCRQCSRDAGIQCGKGFTQPQPPRRH